MGPSPSETRPSSRQLLVGALWASAVAATGSWETVLELVETFVQRSGPGEYTKEITFALIVTIQLLAIKRFQTANIRLGSGPLLIAAVLLGMGFISVWWSAVPTYALSEWMLLSTTILALVALLTRFGALPVFIGIALAGHVMVLAAIASSEFPFAVGGYFIYPGKLTPIVQMNLCIMLGLAAGLGWRTATERGVALAAVGLAIVNVTAMLAIDNRTGQLASFVPIGLTGLIVGARTISAPTRFGAINIFVLRIGPAVAVSMSFILMRFTPSSVLGRSLEPTFTGRKTLWEATWQGVLDRPWFGWGWLSGWFDPQFRESVLPEVGGRAPRFYWGHSVWLDLGLSIGMLGVVLGAVFVGWALLSPINASQLNNVISLTLVAALSVHLMFTSLHREAQLPFAVLVAAALVRSGAITSRTHPRDLHLSGTPADGH